MRGIAFFAVFLGLGWARHGGTFVENKGQIYAEARFEAVWHHQHIYLTPTGIALLLTEREPFEKAHFDRWGEPIPVKAHFLRITWIGANSTEPIGELPEETRYNFFQGPWRATDARGFHQVRYPNLYPGVDLIFHLTPEGLKWDWHVQHPEALQKIRLRYEGVTTFIQGTTLFIETSIGTLTEKLPLVYLANSKNPLPARYRMEGPLIGYELLEPTSDAIVVDPVVVFSTFSGSYSDNWGFTATYDLQGNAYAGGNVKDGLWTWNPGGIYFPVTPGAVQTTFGGGVDYPHNQPIFWSTDIALWKVNPSGTVRLWATYLGGSNNEQPHSLVTDPQGNLYILGATRSTNFPVTPNAFQTSSGGGIDIIVACINAAGNTLLGSTYIGGSGEDGLNSRSLPLYYFYADDGRGEIFLGDTACYIISSTRSPNFPVTSGAYQTSFGGTMDAVICKFSLDLSQLYASTFLGGSGADAGYSIRLGFGGAVYVAGGTNSPNFPTTAGAYQTTYQGGRADGWLAILSPNLDQLLISTYWGTPAYDQIFMIDIDRQGLPWGAGHTEGNLTPTPGSYGFSGRKQFVFSMDGLLTQVTRLSVWGSPGRTTPNITISAFAADRCGYVYVSGWGGLDAGVPGVNIGSTTGLPTTPNANQTITDGADFYVVAFQPNLTGLAYASFWGGPISQEHVDGGTSRFDNRGIIYQSVCGGCGGNSDFPTTPNSISTLNRSPNCNNALFKIDFQLGEPVVAALALTPPGGCAPFAPTIQNLSQNGVSYYWNFGNGQTSTSPSPTGIIYTQPGVYTITLVAENLATCNQRDTLRRVITVFPKPEATFSYQGSCGLTLSLSANQNLPGHTYLWRTGDGQTLSGPNVVHTYAAPGTYTVRLIVTNPHGCTDSTEQRISVTLPTVRANFQWTGDTCQGRFSFQNLSTDATSFVWIFSTGDTLRSRDPVYVFPAPGTYEVILIAYDSLGCTDTMRRTIPVSRAVVAAFSESIDFCELRVQLTNSSIGGGSFFWSFGDGNVSTAQSPTHTYSAPGRYTILLIVASPDSLCWDTLRKEIEIDFRSEAQAEVFIDTCTREVRFVSRSRFANQVLWQINGETFSNPILSWSAPEAGTYTWMLVTNPSASPFCRDTLFGTVSIPAAKPLDSLRWEGDICGEWIRFEIPLPAERILTVVSGGLTYPPGTSTIVQPLRNPHLYQLQVIYIDEYSCRDTFMYSLSSGDIFERLLFVPNVFTPNGDGINDEFRIVGSPECIQELAIYDRWGRQIYVTRMPPFAWDGHISNEELASEGAYVYVIRLRGYVRAGTVTLLR
ncbi:MAG: PKD domain-containing protein [Bacteroidia bacterium]|nr:PKD domain-containing protein [Bacteroidia bacterium]MDW8057153.1 PKD domain-containing protein [Bacteroidia bacterium]